MVEPALFRIKSVDDWDAVDAYFDSRIENDVLSLGLKPWFFYTDSTTGCEIYRVMGLSDKSTDEVIVITILPALCRDHLHVQLIKASDLTRVEQWLPQHRHIIERSEHGDLFGDPAGFLELAYFTCVMLTGNPPDEDGMEIPTRDCVTLRFERVQELMQMFIDDNNA